MSHLGRSGSAHRRVPTMAALVVALGTLVAACSSPSPTASTSSSVPPPTEAGLPALAPPPPVTWTTCPTHPALQCGTVPMPLDYRRPSAGTLSIAVTRAPALVGSPPGGPPPGGTLFVNPGGPGESGNEILPILLPLLPPEVRSASDVVSFDPRGTGASTPLKCGTEPATVTAVEPVPAGVGQPLPGTPVFAGITRACAAEHPSLTAAVDTVATARDMDRIRQALGLSTISYYGLSYGTVLGSVYAELFPHHLRAMVLDGAVDMNASLAIQATEQAPAAERSLDHLLATCAADPTCPLGPDPQGLYDRVSASLTAHPLPAPGDGDDVPVTLGDLDTATLFVITALGATSSYESALLAASHGDGSGLRKLALGFVVDIDRSPLVDVQWAITCNDTVDHPSPVAAGTLARQLAGRWPRIGGYAVTYNLGGCVAWPNGRQPVSDTHPTAAPPVLVIGNTGDPNTPLIGAKHLAALFPHASQLTWVGWGHTWLLSGSTDPCVRADVSRYLLTDVLPSPGSVCT
ncbi:MAG TPA: alpha/beta hydrolase [Acidimicrobiales bacterium]